MKIVILGASHWHASDYYSHSRKLGHEIVLIDENVERVCEKAEKNGFAWHSDYGVLDKLKPDFAFCLGRHDQMADITTMCIDRRIPFMAEKPGAPDAATMTKLARRCDDLKLFNAAPFCLRWDASVRRVKQLIDTGALGRVAHLHVAYFVGAAQRYRGWGCGWVLEKEKSFGGSIYNEGVHCFDLLRYWGFEPTYRAGRASHNLNRGEVDDVISLLLDCGDAYAVAESGYLVNSPFGGHNYSLFCEKANIDYRHGELTIRWANGEREVTKNPPGDFRALMLAEVFSLLADGKPAPSTLHDMVGTLKVCDAYRDDQ